MPPDLGNHLGQAVGNQVEQADKLVELADNPFERVDNLFEPVEGMPIELVGDNPVEQAGDSPLEQNLAEDNPDFAVGLDIQGFVEDKPVIPGGNLALQQLGVLGNPLLGIQALALDFRRTVGQSCCIQRYDSIVAVDP